MSHKVALVDDLATIRRFQSEVAAVREADEPYAVRMTVHVLAVAVAAAVIFSIFAKVDRIVTSESGQIVATVQPTVFQALDNQSIIKSIDVSAGQRVVKGQLLATLDPTFAGADVQQLADQVDSLDAEIERATAELQNREPVFSTGGSATLQKYIALQREYHKQRIAQYKAQVDSYDQKIKQVQATIKQAQDDVARYKQRDAIARQIDQMKAKLLEKGAGSLLNKLVAQDAQVEIMRQQEDAANNVIAAQHQLDALRADRESFIQSWYGDTSKELVTARNSRDTADAQSEKARKHKDLVRLVAPDDAVVLKVTKLSVGSVLNSGDQILTLTPLSSPMQAELDISPRDIGFLRVGDKTTLKIDAFNFTHYGTAEGRVKWISDGAFSFNNDTNQPTNPYYKVRVAIDHMNFRNVPKTFRLIPGMTLQGDIKVGRRTVGSYIWSAVARTGGQAMREP